VLWGRPWEVDLSRFPVPVHVFAGQQDPFIPFARGLAAGGAQVHVLPGGHMCHLLPGALDGPMDVLAQLARPAPTS
jgi:pimeloyl-ACP methyl ester carboxylesterase